MYDVNDTYQMFVKARSENAFKPEEEISDDYSMLLSIRMRNKSNHVSDFFSMFKNCHLTNNKTIDMNDGVKIVHITDRDGKKTSSDSVPRYGIFIRNNLPMWIIEIVLEIKMSFAYLFTEYDNVKIGSVDTEDKFNAWYDLASNNMIACSDDFIITTIDTENLKATLKMIDNTWELEDGAECVIFKIIQVSNTDVVISPQEHLGRLLPFHYKMSLDNFKKEILEGRIRLYAVRIE